MNSDFNTKDKKALLKVFSGICGNLAAGWFGLILIAPGFFWPENFSDWFNLTRSVLLGIVFLVSAYLFERKIK